MPLPSLLEAVAGHVAGVLGIEPEFLLPLPVSPPPPLPLARYIDHTLLRPGATPTEVRHLCTEARRFNFRAVCVNPVWVRLAVEELLGTETAVCTVCGFPLGANLTEIKVREAEAAINDGATEIDVVIGLGFLKAGDYPKVLAELLALRRATAGRVLKVILETGLLTPEEKIAGALLARYAGADFVKTSTGFLAPGATVEDVALLRSAVGWSIGVKASGGIRDRETATAMLAAGATRIGTSSGTVIVEGASPAAEKAYDA
ncbi:MAG: deoxyribose-phosphate aldolase [Firmicutes bacterium]|nr:deoxyribose-phosphate aldolase [Bacillota bacterium]